MAIFLIFSILFQSIPVKTEAFNLQGFINKIMKKINIPDEVKVTDDGNITLGKWKVAKCVSKKDLNGNGIKTCTNPFKGVTLGEDKIETETPDHRPLLIKTKLPEICQLKIPLNEGEETMSQEERLALMKSCYDLQRVQRAAANEAYFAREMFNRTDPLSDCFFVKNCRTSCKLRFGEIGYTVGWQDIAKLFLPGGWILFIGKVLNIVKKVQTVYDVFNEIKVAARSGIKAINDFLKETSYLATFYQSLQRMVNLNGINGFTKMFNDYSKNLLYYSQAKTESLNLVKKTIGESDRLIELIEKIQGLDSIFKENSANQQQLDRIIKGYVARLESLKTFLDKLNQQKKEIEGAVPSAYNNSCQASNSNTACWPKRIIFGNEEKTPDKKDSSINFGNNKYHLWKNIYSTKWVLTGSDGLYREFDCPKNNKFLEEDYTIQPKIQGNPDIIISFAPAEICQVACIGPTNNWYGKINEIYNKAVSLKEKVDDYVKCINNPGTLSSDELTCRRNHLDSGNYSGSTEAATSIISELIKKQQDLLSLTNSFSSSKNFWLITTSTPNILFYSPEETDKQCVYDSNFYYDNWLSKTSETTDFDLVKINQSLSELENKYKAKSDSHREIKRLLESPLVSVNIELSVSQMRKMADSASQISSSEGQELMNKGNSLVEKLKKISNDLKDIEDIWQAAVGSYDASTHLAKLIATKNLSEEISSLVKNSFPVLSEIENLIPSVFSDPDKQEYLKETSLLRDRLNKIASIVGEYKNGNNGFLGQIKDFEDTNMNKTFEMLKVFVDDILSIQNAIKNLANMGNDIKKLKPSLEIVPADVTKMKNFDDFKKGIAKNPLSYLNDIIAGIESNMNNLFNIFGEVENSVQNTAPTLNQVDQGAASDAVSLAEEIKDTWLNRIRVSIFGNEKIKIVCKNLSLLMKSDPLEIENSCQDVYARYNNVLPYKNTCANQEMLSNYLDDVDTISGFDDSKDRLSQFCSLKLTNPGEWWQNNVCKATAPHGQSRYYDVSPPWQEIDCVNNKPTKNEYDEVCQRINECQEWEEIQQPKAECDYYEQVVKPALQDNCSQSSQETKCINFITLDPSQKNLRSFFDFLCQKNILSTKTCQIRNRKTLIVDLTNSSKEAKKALSEVRLACLSGQSNIMAPLGEIMNVYAFLLGIKSGTLFYKGLKTSYQDAKLAYQNAQKAIRMIKELPKKLKSAHVSNGGGSGFNIKPIKCVPEPAFGYNNQTGPNGGPVCPEVDKFFSVIEANFDIVRQNLNQIDLRRRKLGIKDLIRIFGGAMIPKIGERLSHRGYGIKYPSINEVYDEAKNIRNRARNLWAIGTAMNFAAKNCTCGKSFCVLPVCISGIPLTPAPLKEPYCYLVYILRHPFEKQIEVLENYLK